MGMGLIINYQFSIINKTINLLIVTGEIWEASRFWIFIRNKFGLKSQMVDRLYLNK
jgi:hypothetical protein